MNYLKNKESPSVHSISAITNGAIHMDSYASQTRWRFFINKNKANMKNKDNEQKSHNDNG